MTSILFRNILCRSNLLPKTHKIIINSSFHKKINKMSSAIKPKIVFVLGGPGTIFN